MYALIVVEPRYVTAFLTMICVGILVGLPVPAQFRRKIALLIALVTLVMLLVPVASRVYAARAPRTNDSLVGAEALKGLGIQAGDPAARISPSNAELTVERILRVEIVAEVDHDHVAEFWKSPTATQDSLLQQFALHGVKAVIATSPEFNADNKSEWIHLGSTQYWAWLPPSH